MKTPLVNIHTHRRTGEGIELVSVEIDCGMPLREELEGDAERFGTVPYDGDAGAYLPEPPFSVGIHPWQIKDAANDGLGECDNLKAALRAIQTIGASAHAIGEIGLDYAALSNRDLQEQLFIEQLRLAEALKKPVIIHCVKAFEPIMATLAQFSLPAVIFHGFVGSKEQATRAIAKGYYLSLGETSLGSPKTIEAMKQTPLDHLFLETDVSPLSLVELYSRVSALLATPLADLTEQLHTNYLKVFDHDRTLA
jgi:TatD DNase family protein